jgi:pyridoxal phosphate enzyme (YggS family)
VTKTVGPEEVRALDALGVHDFGENRVRELVTKAASLADIPSRWHMVGHLQRNKVKDLLKYCTFVHSLDSDRLAGEMSRRASVEGLEVELLIEVNLGGEQSKFGVSVEAAEALAAETISLPALRLRGLMTMAPVDDDPEKARPLFAGLRELARKLAADLPPGTMAELSMGMTQDFEVAVEEGATMIRIGSALFA